MAEASPVEAEGVSESFYSLHSAHAALGVDTPVHVWPGELCAFPPLALIPQSLSRVREHGHSLIFPSDALAGRDISAVTCAALAAPAAAASVVKAVESVFHPHPK